MYKREWTGGYWDNNIGVETDRYGWRKDETQEEFEERMRAEGIDNPYTDEPENNLYPDD